MLATVDERLSTIILDDVYEVFVGLTVAVDTSATAGDIGWTDVD